VLSRGESGTGKELMARAIHELSPRHTGPFIAVACGAIPETLLEAERFGYEKGAFTGATSQYKGRIEMADQGTLFLDEIGDISLKTQVDLLRVIQEREFRRLGGKATMKVDIRIIAATNKNLEEMIAKSEFREDLYYRLKVVDLHLPPLREHKGDIPELAGMFIRQNNARFGMNISDISPRAMSALLAYDWPGNVRELRNVIESAMLFCDDEVISLSHLPSEIARLV